MTSSDGRRNLPDNGDSIQTGFLESRATGQEDLLLQVGETMQPANR
jgi:hypothetical protein